MAIRKTLQIGNPKLKAPNQKITDFSSPDLQKLIKDLKDSMYDSKLVGMAAPQIGENFRLFVTEPRQTKTRGADQADDFKVYINPEIIDKSDEEIIIYEGCGSVLNGNIFGPVSRPRWIKIKAMDENQNMFELKADGILGRVIQHENDHMRGIEFTEIISDYSKLMTREYYVEQIKPAKWHIQNSIITMREFRQS